MRELGLTGLSEDGQFLVAHDALTDESFHIPTDDRLTSLLDASSNGPADTQPEPEAGNREPTMEVTLNPRDIQARVRRGESAEQVAESSGMALEKVRAFAIPVIAEREFIVEQARATSVRRLHASGAPGLILGSLVDESLVAQGSSAEAATWDSWRREDGRWTIVVSPDGDADTATFLFDAKGRYVLAADDAAHALIGDLALQETAEPAQPVETVQVREYVEVIETVEVFEVPPTREATIDPAVDDLPILDEAPYQFPEPDEIIERPTPVSSLKEARDRRALEQLAMSIDAEAAAPAEASDVEITEEQDVDVAVASSVHPSQQHRSQHAKKRHERRRVPSWDEIMFGGSARD